MNKIHLINLNEKNNLNPNYRLIKTTKSNYFSFFNLNLGFTDYELNCLQIISNEANQFKKQKIKNFDIYPSLIAFSKYCAIWCVTFNYIKLSDIFDVMTLKFWLNKNHSQIDEKDIE